MSDRTPALTGRLGGISPRRGNARERSCRLPGSFQEPWHGLLSLRLGRVWASPNAGWAGSLALPVGPPPPEAKAGSPSRRRDSAPAVHRGCRLVGGPPAMDCGGMGPSGRGVHRLTCKPIRPHRILTPCDTALAPARLREDASPRQAHRTHRTHRTREMPRATREIPEARERPWGRPPRNSSICLRQLALRSSVAERSRVNLRFPHIAHPTPHTAPCLTPSSA